MAGRCGRCAHSGGGDVSNYYRAGDSYGRGGNYAYQAGGIFGSIGKILGGVAKVGLAGITGGPGAALAKAGQLLIQKPQQPMSSQVGIQVGGPSGLRLGAFEDYAQGPVGTMLRNEFLPGCQLKGTRPNKSGYYKQITKGDPTNVIYVPPKSVCVKSRRLNVANPRALRRSIRRAQGFAKLARRVMTFVSAKAPRGRAKFKKSR